MCHLGPRACYYFSIQSTVNYGGPVTGTMQYFPRIASHSSSRRMNGGEGRKYIEISHALEDESRRF